MQGVSSEASLLIIVIWSSGIRPPALNGLRFATLSCLIITRNTPACQVFFAYIFYCRKPLPLLHLHRNLKNLPHPIITGENTLKIVDPIIPWDKGHYKHPKNSYRIDLTNGYELVIIGSHLKTRRSHNDSKRTTPQTGKVAPRYVRIISLT